MSIARMWRGTTRARDAEAYTAYLAKTGVRELRDTPGNESVLVLRRIEGDEAEFFVISIWPDMASIAAFARDDPSRARYFPEDERYLLEVTPEVEHFEVTVASPSEPERTRHDASRMHSLAPGRIRAAPTYAPAERSPRARPPPPCQARGRA